MMSPTPCTPSYTSAGSRPARQQLVQSPTPPFVGAADASHGFKEHVAAVSVPAVQELVPETTYPELHVGWHVSIRSPGRQCSRQQPHLWEL